MIKENATFLISRGSLKYMLNVHFGGGRTHVWVGNYCKREVGTERDVSASIVGFHLIPPAGDSKAMRRATRNNEGESLDLKTYTVTTTLYLSLFKAMRSIKGTPLYMAPELVREQPYNHTAGFPSRRMVLLPESFWLGYGKPCSSAGGVVSCVDGFLTVDASVLESDVGLGYYHGGLSGLLRRPAISDMGQVPVWFLAHGLVL
ncbi:Serine/threonine-protein kinase TIO [Camellia lanceoleosa]|uniref:Serine/threonine-protein kinase TIO n=1 Tax=Camellia lanceoleosa TaxID=1840588 RepID=A0ACC0GYX7_9ERIC|nr:Serine/threonine-protein kinase TIO [Camellia lanceoleosa]